VFIIDLVGNAIGFGNRFANRRVENKHKTNPLSPEPLPPEFYWLGWWQREGYRLIRPIIGDSPNGRK
jgi:hypothetical protein